MFVAAAFLIISIILLIFIVATQIDILRLTALRARQMAAAAATLPYEGDYKSLIDEKINKHICEFTSPGKLQDACIHALDGGSRRRAILLLEIADTAGGGHRNPNKAINAALFVEYVHSASLVIDDLPEFDNDVIRRDAPTVHAKFGRAVAQLASATLISAAFDCIGRQLPLMNSGTNGAQMIQLAAYLMSATSKGEAMDISANIFAEYGEDAVIDLMYYKTATLFEMSCGLGWLVGGGRLSNLGKYRKYGRYLGMAYQIHDDIEDEQSDGEKSKWNYAITYGTAVAFEDAEKYIELAELTLKHD